MLYKVTTAFLGLMMLAPAATDEMTVTTDRATRRQMFFFSNGRFGDASAVMGNVPASNGGNCFDAATLFTGRNGPKRADEIKAGDELLVARHDGSLVWDTVAVDKSNGPGAVDYLQIEHSDGGSITITAEHYLHSGPSCCDANSLLLAGDLKVGDTVWTHAGAVATSAPTAATVTAITSVKREGAYNFLLDQAGDAHFRSLLANGVVASSFTSDWRLIGSYGFDASDKLRDPIREMARLAGPNRPRVAPEVTKETVKVMRAMEDVIADCVEGHMPSDCTEAKIEEKFSAIEAHAAATLPAEFHHQLSTLVERLAEKHASAVPGFARRLAASAATSAMTSSAAKSVMVKMAAHEAHEVAVRTCANDASCAADMTVAVTVSTFWSSGQVLFVAGALSMLLINLSLAACAVLYRLYKKKEGRTAPVAPSKAEPTPSNV